ncbi:TniB family NTP-binding protein [Elizabethkingia anophelis]|uniref:TniB family NTP-binding protein n=1 Tax=Elizabethkingia anophelis TaxID=1117645 RepID=UPI0030183EEA
MMKHLTKKTKLFVEESTDQDRIHSCRHSKWIGYTQAVKIINRMDELLSYPKGTRMTNMLLVGESNNGKTAILHKFNQKYEAFLDENTGKVVNPIVMVQAPPEPDERRFYNAILENIFAPYKTSEKLDLRYLRVKRMLTEMQTKALIIDEIHHVLAGTPTKQRKFLNVIKHLSNDLQIPIICAGTMLAFNVIQTDQQLANRFEPRVLPKWGNDMEFKRLLASFEALLPLKKESMLTEGSVVMKILAMSDGLIGEVTRILELCSIAAIKSGEEKITRDILLSIDYISPQDRKKRYFA